MSRRGGPIREPVAFPVLGCLGALLLLFGMALVFAAAEIASFLIVAPGPVPRNLSPATIYAARASAWWREPFLVIAPILSLPIAMDFNWAQSPRALIAALKRVRPSGVWIGPAAFVIGFAALALSSDPGLFRLFALGFAGFVAVALASLFLFGWATRAGVPQSAIMVLLSAAGGAVFGVMSAEPWPTLRCEQGASVTLASGASEPCAKILVFSKREAYFLSRPDDQMLIVPKSDANLASVRAAVGPRSVWFGDVKPVE